MSFFKGAFSGKSNEEVLTEWTDNGLKAEKARRAGRRDEDAEQRTAAASSEMGSRWTEEAADPDAYIAINRLNGWS
ncbi:hypothetical protein ACFVRD_41120 [Streptomyces sp. NPDC057908]|uniref:hypothetical protein n=1 Tax=Streptomyces sp. NPDC057908 TaxID=3346276 RepID=UPI0036EF59F6